MSAPKGFTLIELMVTITIIAILASIGAIVYSSVQKNARISKRLQDLQALQTALELYKTATGGYPSNAVGNTSVTCSNSQTALSVLAPNYIVALPNDPLWVSGGSTNCYLYYSELTSGASSQYKIRTNVASTEMSSNDYSLQVNYLDPARDGTADCVVQPGATYTAWALFTTGGCLY